MKRFQIPSLLPRQLAAVDQVPAAALFLGASPTRLPPMFQWGHSVPHPPPTTAQPTAIFVMKEWILSPLEKTSIRWISRGRTVAEIASLEGKSVVEIENCLRSALRTLEAKSIAEVLQKANLPNPD